ncbi:hypothetical protein D1155_05520 [Anaerotruncus sp. 80]|uniref:Uncharacterized protein n=1 Tax=Anaerotruncus colihominis TaxID=169435 RepID=A0A845QK91_9FIRM|nr:hypothetical protein [Anaerotruncus colihominis]NCE98916.1 hypothetical protein [Emergencia sp. 1XD21-10]NCF01762.1 hypothetical protein [Anaerotruncus sp. 80]
MQSHGGGHGSHGSQHGSHGSHGSQQAGLQSHGSQHGSQDSACGCVLPALFPEMVPGNRLGKVVQMAFCCRGAST